MRKIDHSDRRLLRKYAFGDYLSGNNSGTGNSYTGQAKGTGAVLAGVAAYNPLIGAAAALGSNIAENQEAKDMAFDIETGKWENKKHAKRADILRSTFDPFTTTSRTFSDKDASGGEKAAAAASWLVPGTGLIFGKKRRERQSEENMAMSAEYNRGINTKKLANLRANFSNGEEQRNTVGTNSFADGGDLETSPEQPTRIMPRAITSVGETPKSDKLVIPYERAKSLYRAQLFGTAEQPFIPYKFAVERGLTPTTQKFVYDRHATSDPYKASIMETERMNGKGFYDVNNGQITTLIPTQDIPLDRAQRANQFMVDLQNRGYIKYGCGGELNKMANGGVLNYAGQTHDGPNGGIEVDRNGNPSQYTNNESVGKVEAGESSWKNPKTGKVYIFSNRISYNK